MTWPGSPSDLTKFLGPVSTLLLSMAPTTVAAAQTNSDVFLAPLLVQNHRVTVGVPANITNRPGYDNQPSFSDDGELVYYTSQRDGQTDIYRYDRINRTTTQVTATPESEYSAQIIPGSSWISVVRVEADSSQRLWRVDPASDSTELLLPAVEPVGYYAWISDTLAALFVVGDPPVLRLATTKGDTLTLARGIGRSLQPAIEHSAVAFTLTDSTGGDIISLAFPSGTVTPLTPVLPGSQDFAWVAADLMIMARDSLLYQWRLGDEAWSPVETEWGGERPSRITRLAVSRDRKWLALVGID